MTCWWVKEALECDAAKLVEPLNDRLHADVCIVGGGYTGLWTALHLRSLEPSLKVVVLEREYCGAGASGRNGGFVLTLWRKFLTLKQMMSTDDALAVCEASEAAIDAIGRFSEDFDRVSFTRTGWLWAATNRSQVGAWSGVMNQLSRHGRAPFRELDKVQAQKLSGTASIYGAAFERAAGTVQPMFLVRALRESVIAAGSEVYEGSPMTRIRQAPGGLVEVQTPEGGVLARKVVLALNAWAASLPELRNRILVVASDAIATVPAQKRLDAAGVYEAPCISDARLLVNYWRRTPDGRVVIGRGGSALSYTNRVGDAFLGDPRRGRDPAASFGRLYPRLSDLPIEYSWTGPVARTYEGLPFFCRLGKNGNVLCGAGYSGNGVGPAHVGGRVLASLALDRDDEWGGFPLVREPGRKFPPPVARYLGAPLVRGAVRREEAALDEERLPSSIVRRLATIAPGR